MKPGDEFAEAWLTRAESLRDRQRAGDHLSAEEQYELATLSEKATTPTPPEVADDPRTLFTDESRRPLLDGTDWNEHNRKMACDEVANFAKMLVARFGVPLAEAALQAGIAALKR